MRAVLLFSLLLLTTAGSAQQADWQLYKADDVTKVEYRHDKTRLLHIRATTEVTSLTGAFLHLLEDTSKISAWAANTEKAELLGQPDANTHLVHTYFTAIWPVSKRDMVTQSSWQQDPASGVLTMTITDMGQHFPPVAGYVRMQQVKGVWTLTPLASGQLQIRYQGQANPAGKLPHFIADKVALKALFKTFTQLNTVLPGYQRPYKNVAEN
ncbi:MAG TPA: START domain-containing protein [Rheinheimera sp.]|nr:START domain-containing protein [Rheinheimera sp.]